MKNAMTERAYDNLHNEGADGHNPIRAAREAGEHDRIRTLRTTAPAALTAEQCEEREAMVMSPLTYRALTAEERAELATIRARIIELHLLACPEWSQATTAARRAEWNARKVMPADRAKAEADLGWTFQALCAAIAIWKRVE